MEYQKIMNFLDNTTNQLTKVTTKNWVGINDESYRMYNTNSQINFKVSMLRSNLRDYSDSYILVKEIISITRVLALAEPDNDGKKVMYKNCAPFTECISEINNT